MKIKTEFVYRRCDWVKKSDQKNEREELRSSARRDDRIDTHMMTLMPFQPSIFNTLITLSRIESNIIQGMLGAFQMIRHTFCHFYDPLVIHVIFLITA